MNIATFLDQAARAFAERPAVTVGNRVLRDYRALGWRVAALAGGLRALPGVRPGDRVLLAMSNSPDYVELLFATWHAGLCAVPANARLHPRETAALADGCGARLAFVTPDLAEGLAGPLADVEAMERTLVIGDADHRILGAADAMPLTPAGPDDPAWLFFTSGTTGKPKAATLTHRNLTAMAISYLADVDFLTDRDSILHVAALSHASGLFALSFVPRGANQVLPESGGFDEGELADLVARHPSATFFVPPTLLRRLTRSEPFACAPVGNIRTILVGAAPVYAEDLKAALGRFGPRIWNAYGQGESPCTITCHSKEMIARAAAAGDDERLASVGIARTGTDVRVATDDGVECPPGTPGEVVVSGDVVMKGYWEDPEATRAAFGPLGLRTGDLGVMDESGFLWLKDRARDLVISGGLNVYPREVEEVLLAHPDVADVAVVGAPDAEWGERVSAFIVWRAGAARDEEALDRLCLDRLARFKRPRLYRAIDALPRNAYGKVLKTELRALCEGAGTAAEGASG